MALPGNFEFIPPDMGEGGFSFRDGVIYLDTSFTIGNNGYHDITNFSLSVQAMVEDDVVVTDYRTAPVNIPTGERRVVDVSIPIDLAPLQSSGYLVFQPANVSFTVGFDGTTTRSLLDFAVSFTFVQQFEALLPSFDVDFGNSTFTNETGEYAWIVPYVVGTAPFLQGNATAGFTILNETGGLVAETNATIPLGGPWSSNLTFLLDQAQAQDLQTGSQDLTLRVAVELPGGVTFTYETTVRWEPGGG